MTTGTIVWQQESSIPGNAEALEAIRQWWAGLANQELFWQQRIRQAAVNVAQLDWELQRFDERFYVKHSELRGITLYWQKATDDREQSSTPQKLELDSSRQYLYIYPQSQPDLVIRVTGPRQVVYQTIQLSNPQIEHQIAQGQYILILQDPTQEIAVKAVMNAETLLALKRQLP